MESRIKEIINHQEENYLFPFFWMHSGETEKIPFRVKKVYESGCRALCVESRPHEAFCEDAWWQDMEIILKEAEKYGMKVWILDDKHFPTGYANGILEKEDQKERRWFLREHHVDVAGPMQEAAVLVPFLKEEEQILEAVAYERIDSEDGLSEKFIRLTDHIQEDFLFFDVPDGFYRIFFVIKTRLGSRENQKYYISNLSGTSAHKLIQAVYEPHYQHFARYFGNTIAGFFSDEPGYYTVHNRQWGYDQGEYYHTLGQPGLLLPWEDEVAGKMAEHEELARKDKKILCELPKLWYAAEDAPKVRLAYMDTITGLWYENFSMQIGEWCRAHGVEYTGHIIEDMDSHQRIGSGAGHYFRSLGGQDISGVDIVLHQVMPGYADHNAASIAEKGSADRRFFHYILPKLAVSLARVEPRMAGRAMCEVFGAYGWAESVTFMKWLMDFLLVRGVNHFVPHAFTDNFPDPDCPPHFYAQGNNPQFEGFTVLMNYTNQVSHLLSGLSLYTEGAILYSAEGEWMSTPEYVSMNDAAKTLYDAHVDYDILPADVLGQAGITDGKLVVNGHEHRFLVVPQAADYPGKIKRMLKNFMEEGFPVYLLCSGKKAGKEEDIPGQMVTLDSLIPELERKGLFHKYSQGDESLRIGRFCGKNAECFMLFWEDIRKETDTVIKLPRSGRFLRCEPLSGKYSRDFTSDGRITVQLSPYQSQLILFDHFTDEFWDSLPNRETWVMEDRQEFLWDISLKEQGKEDTFRKVCEKSSLFNITGKDGWPHFSGKMLYETTLTLKETEERRLGIDLGNVGQTARLKVNGRDLGVRISPPYRWNLEGVLLSGENKIEIEVANTLTHRVHERFSEYMQISPSGLMGPVTLWKIEQ